MGTETGIKWTDSTYNSWFGCTKVEGAPACRDCYAEIVDKRATPKGQDAHWGLGAPRRLLSEHARNEPLRWQRNADQFFAAHGRRQRVFTLSMGDLFDKEVANDWRNNHCSTMETCDRLEWQICTKRVSLIHKLAPMQWLHGDSWPHHIGVLITVVTQKEADRDIPRLLRLKSEFSIPWVGISYEPAQELVRFGPWLHGDTHLDWIIFGGKSGGNWNDGPFDWAWAYETRDACAEAFVPFFMKQAAGFRPTDAMIPADLMIRQWPVGH